MWTWLQIGPATPSDRQITHAQIGLHVKPTGEEEDLRGEVFFDDLQLIRLPRMLLGLNQPHGVFYRGEPVEVTCEVSGVTKATPVLHLQLLDADGRIVEETDRQLEPAAAGADAGIAGRVMWTPAIAEVGFYRIRASMRDEHRLLLEREISLAVTDPWRPERGEFGWSIRRQPLPLDTRALASLLERAGVHWVKLPVWFGEQQRAEADRIAELVERLEASNIELVGVLDRPPSTAPDLARGEAMPVASIFVEPELWQPLIDPVLTRLSMKVRRWQLGGDDDMSFMGLPGLNAIVRQVKEHMEKFGQEAQLGLAWDWMYQQPVTAEPAWRFLSLVEQPAFTPQELADALDHDRPQSAERWVQLEPLSKSGYRLATRAADLVQRMVMARVHGADVVVVPDPFDADHGVMHPDGSPSELFVPWVTAARFLAGKTYLGSIQMPRGSQNYLFADDTQTVMVVWNERPAREVIYLGDRVQIVDLWGRRKAAELDGHRQVVPVGPAPRIVTGVNRAVAMWRMRFALDRRPLASVFGRPQKTSFRCENTFSQAVSVRAEMHAPTVWGGTEGVRIEVADGRSRRATL